MAKNPSVRSLIMMSMRMRSGRSSFASLTPSAPSYARQTAKPLASRKHPTASAKSWSSSTISIRFSSLIVLTPRRRLRLPPGRHAHPKGGAGAGLARHLDGSTHFRNDSLADMQPQPGSRRLLRAFVADPEELVEKERTILFRNPDTGIGHPNHHFAA